MTFKVIQYNIDKHKQNQVLHRYAVDPRKLELMGYNSALAPKSNAYLPVVQLEGEEPRKND